MSQIAVSATPPASVRRAGGALLALTVGGGLVVAGAAPASAAAPAGAAPAASAAATTSAGSPAQAALPAAGTGVPAAVPAATPCTSRVLLRYGSRGASVRYVQSRLGVRPRSGWFGPITRAAVKRYQRSKGLVADGVVGPRTWRAFCGGGGGGGGGNYPGIPASVQRLNWAALAQCESGGNPRALNPSGKYRGLYQFDFPTWRSVGGKGDPIDNSAREQTFRAMKLYVARSWRPWPQCGPRLYR